MEVIYSVKNLGITYPTEHETIIATENVSFDIPQGVCTAIVGESGSGKTVTAKAMIGLTDEYAEMSDSAELIFKGKDVTHLTQKEWDKYRGNQIGMVFQDALISLNPTMKIGKQIVEPIINHEKNINKNLLYENTVELLASIGIKEPKNVMNKFPHQLSGGMRQRIMIASAIISKPSLLIADEPTTSLDVTVQAQIIKLLKQIQNEMNMTIILITHNLGIVAEMADYVVVMKDGTVIEKGVVNDIFYNPQNNYTKELLSSVPTL